MDFKGRALICPLDWGMGHATRCIPVIDRLIALGYEVVVAAGGRPGEFIRREYPGLRVIDFPGVEIRYPGDSSMVWAMIRLLPRFLRGIHREHRYLKRLIAMTGATLVISDNRYGCWYAGVPSVLITHQLAIRVPDRYRLTEKLLNFFNYKLISRYTACWIPDFELHRGLAGNLSHPRELPPNARYIGILSRFTGEPDVMALADQPAFDLLVMLSGPEPQRTILEEKILRQLRDINLQVAMVRGMPEAEEIYSLYGKVVVYSHLESEKLRDLILRSALVICRSGYSSIMDLVTLGKRAIFIPTPGQTEQEYLSRYLMEKKIFFSMGQEDFDLFYALEMSNNFHGMVIRNDHKILEEEILSLRGSR